MDIQKELNLALLTNLRFTAKLLAGLFWAIAILQTIVVTYLFVSGENFGGRLDFRLAVLGPAFLASAALAEGYTIRYLDRMSAAGKPVSRRFSYFIAFVQTSFPGLIMLFAGNMAAITGVFTSLQILNSPPSYLFFIMILVSSLMLEFRLSLFAGFVSAVEYSLLTWYFLVFRERSNPMDVMNNIIKSLLLLGCGILAGYVSGKIREAVLSSLKAKDDLINRLDRMVNEKTAEIRHQKEVILQKNKDITDSINYAKRIQQAILPRKELLDQMFPEYFVFYRPRDVVSGDFYWASRHGGRKVIAACDCTGHGVPGAFMSMVGGSLLGEIVNKQFVTEPAKILDLMRARLIENLQQTGAEGESKDGMDVAICTIEDNVLEFSGANNPLYHIRGKVLTEYKGDKHPIAIHMGTDHCFSSSRIALEKGDAVYIFTDGFADQFGGSGNKKFLYRRLQALLLDNSGKPAADQRNALEKAFLEWTGSNDQVDDVLVIGIRVT
jgi:serine phosphatase RsbU (regulator of sigma subunit)